MVYKNFRIQCISRIVLTGITIFVFLYLILKTVLYFPIAVAGFFILYQIVSLIRYVEKTNKNLTRFLQSIRYADFSQTFSGRGQGKSFNELQNAFNGVMNEFKKARSEKEEHFRFLHTVVQHVGIALLAFRQNGDVELINTPAKRLFRVAQLRNINSLKSFSQPLIDKLYSLKPGRKELIKIENNGAFLQLAVYSTEFKLRENIITLVSIQDIRSELEEKEMEAWHNLIRVLTHEIMNSITPISSLASTVNDLLQNQETFDRQRSDENQKEVISDVQSAVQTIQKRSQGLLHFVDNYRSLTNIPKPDFKIFPIAELFGRMKKLMQEESKDKQLTIRKKINPESLELTADPELIEQVLINLIKNSVQACENLDIIEIDLEAGMDERGKVFIKVIDRGPGIEEDVLEKIFIPFYTTKQTGSGIGLSLSRQIVRLHGGTISAFSKPNERTVFMLRF